MTVYIEPFKVVSFAIYNTTRVAYIMINFLIPLGNDKVYKLFKARSEYFQVLLCIKRRNFYRRV